MRKRIVAVIAALFAVAAAWAVTASLESAELSVFLLPTGNARLAWRIEWNCTGGTMSGFYFQEPNFSPQWDMKRSWADFPDGTRLPLSILDAGDKWDVILADGKRFSGRAWYVMSYEADFAAAGFLGRTTKDDGTELVYFDWGANEFDTAMGYRAVRITFPVKVSGEKLPDEEKDAIRRIFLTEPEVNAENRIDFYGVKGEDGFYLTALFYQESPGADRSQRLRFYVPLEWFEGAGGFALRSAASPDSSAGTSSYSGSSGGNEVGRNPVVTIFAFGAMICAALGLFAWKASKVAKRKEALASISWAGDSWSPPKLQTGSYQVPGKIAEGLHPAEVAILLDLPLTRVVEIMIDGLVAQGIVEVASKDPLSLRVLTAEKAADPIEEDFLAAFGTTGQPLSGLLADFFEKLIKRLQEKIWDCDLEATKAHYRERAAAQAKAEASPADDERARAWRADPYWVYWRSWHAMETDPRRYDDLAIPDSFDRNYSDFMRSSACFSGCYSPKGADTVDACHDACHNACHDACHSACHDACHSACHDACHSACVSGGAH